MVPPGLVGLLLPSALQSMGSAQLWGAWQWLWHEVGPLQRWDPTDRVALFSPGKNLMQKQAELGSCSIPFPLDMAALTETCPWMGTAAVCAVPTDEQGLEM